MNEIKDSKLKQDLKLFQQVKILATQVWQPEFDHKNSCSSTSREVTH